MTEHLSAAAALRRELDQLLSREVRPFLKARGFTKSGGTFHRSRNPLYDLINFQGSNWNRVTPQYGFFVNVGVGSTEMDAVHLEWTDRNNDKPTTEYVLDRRWEQLVSAMPSEVSFDESTDLELFADILIGGLESLLDVIDAIETTRALAEWAVDRNLLHHMEKTCHYLVSVGDIDSFSRYVTTLRNRFSNDPRWQFFNRKLVVISGSASADLIAQGLLDADVTDPRN